MELERYSLYYHNNAGITMQQAEDFLKENPRILLYVCEAHSFDYRYQPKNRIYSSQFFNKKKFHEAWPYLKLLFRKIYSYKVETDSEECFYICQINGISPSGDSLLKHLASTGNVPCIWKKLYLSEKMPQSEPDGDYHIEKCAWPDIEVKASIFELLAVNSFFYIMDVSNLLTWECEENSYIQSIISGSKEAYIRVENCDGYCSKILYLKR